MTVGARVLIVLDTGAAWSRGILRGFSSVAHEQGWILLHYHQAKADLPWLMREWDPAAVVLGPDWGGAWPAVLRARAGVSVNADRSAEGVASVCLDEEQIADVALAHLLSNAFTDLATFRFDESPFAVARDRRFRQRAARAGRLVPGWWVDGAEPSRRYEAPAAIVSWLRGLPAPCGVFACCDSWARFVARYARVAGLRVPEDVAIVGVDNDTTECELSAPPLSSVAVPWRRVGEEAAALVQRALAGGEIAGRRTVVAPGHIVVRRSSDTLAIQDRVAVSAVAWIRSNAHGRLSVPAVARAAHVSRQRLERRFRAVLGRTVMQEIRRARVELAKRLLASTRLGLPAVAERSGFTSAALLNAAFRSELGTTPGAYRRRVEGLLATSDE